jgi:hypothetical protein
MRKHRIFRGIFQSTILASSIAVLIAPGTCAFAEEYRGTMEQQMACTPDVFRLCGAQIPDANRIVACLRQNTPQLSGACRAVFESSDSTSNPQAQNPPPSTAPPVRRSSQYQ